MGIDISVDDFGKGNSSLSYLKNNLIEGIKIDKPFIDYLVTYEEGGTLVAGIIYLVG